MSNFEISVRKATRSDPPETDLEYYARPENYEGYSYSYIKRFAHAKAREEKLANAGKSVEKKKKECVVFLYRRYKNLLPKELDDAEETDDEYEKEYDKDYVKEGNTDAREEHKTDVHEDHKSDTIIAIKKIGPILNLKYSEDELSTAFSEISNVSPDSVSDKKIPSETSQTLIPSKEPQTQVPGPTVDADDESSDSETSEEVSLDHKYPEIESSSNESFPDEPQTPVKKEVGEYTGKSDVAAEAEESVGLGVVDLGNDINEAQREKEVSSDWINTLSWLWSSKQIADKGSASGTHRVLIKERFRKAVRMVIMVRTIVESILDKAGKGRHSAFIDLATEEADEETESRMKQNSLAFEPSYFKAKKEISISNEVKNILSTNPSMRTPEMIRTAMIGLQSLKSFAEYPLHMQEKLAQVAWYEKIPAKRIIIRQGHYAENFYFILSGQAVVTILVRDPNTGESTLRTATMMRKGMTFGELALLHHSRRTATVTTQEAVQLLSIGRDDFFDIFMSGGEADALPEHIKFIGSCDFMKDWPIEKLLDNPEMCLLHFFKRNMVIVRDSNDSDWLYVVKSGTCQVLKTLKGVTARLKQKAKKPVDSKQYKLPELCVGKEDPKIDTGLRRKKQSIPKLPQLLVQEEPSPSVTIQIDNTESEEEDESKKEEIEEIQNVSFSKGNFLPNRKAHFSALTRRKEYVVPKKNRPKPIAAKHEKPVDSKLADVYTQVELLKPRDAFGLTTIIFDNELNRTNTVVSLVSKGAECIMLSKEFFSQHANETVRKQLRMRLRPYPTEETFQENLQIKGDWDLYKHVMIEQLTRKEPKFRMSY